MNGSLPTLPEGQELWALSLLLFILALLFASLIMPAMTFVIHLAVRWEMKQRAQDPSISLAVLFFGLSMIGVAALAIVTLGPSMVSHSIRQAVVLLCWTPFWIGSGLWLLRLHRRIRQPAT